MRRLPRTIITLGAAGLALTLAAAPAAAATPVAKGTATALKASFAGMPGGDSGTFTATNDGSKETTSGNNKPAVTIPTGGTLNQGTLNQDAATSRSGNVVSTAACSGLSGSGATVASLGDSNCLSRVNPQTVSLNGGQLKFDTIADALTNNQVFDQLPKQLQDAITGVLGQVGQNAGTTAVQDIIKNFVQMIGNPALRLDAGVIQGRCTADNASASGDAQLLESGFELDFGSVARQNGLAPISIDLPSDPPPNQPFSAGVGDLTKKLTDALTKQLVDSASSSPLAGIFEPGANALSDAGKTLVSTIVSQLVPQLKPLEDNLLKGTLNKQSSTDVNQIHVTALDLQVLPAAQQFAGASLAAIQIGDVTCDGGQAAPAAASAPARPAPAKGVPAEVDSGLSGEEPSPVVPVLGGLLLLGAAGIGVRRLLLARKD